MWFGMYEEKTTTSGSTLLYFLSKEFELRQMGMNTDVWALVRGDDENALEEYLNENEGDDQKIAEVANLLDRAVVESKKKCVELQRSILMEAEESKVQLFASQLNVERYIYALTSARNAKYFNRQHPDTRERSRSVKEEYLEQKMRRLESSRNRNDSLDLSLSSRERREQSSSMSSSSHRMTSSSSMTSSNVHSSQNRTMESHTSSSFQQQQSLNGQSTFAMGNHESHGRSEERNGIVDGDVHTSQYIVQGNEEGKLTEEQSQGHVRIGHGLHETTHSGIGFHHEHMETSRLEDNIHQMEMTITGNERGVESEEVSHAFRSEGYGRMENERMPKFVSMELRRDGEHRGGDTMGEGGKRTHFTRQRSDSDPAKYHSEESADQRYWVTSPTMEQTETKEVHEVGSLSHAEPEYVTIINAEDYNSTHEGNGRITHEQSVTESDIHDSRKKSVSEKIHSAIGKATKKIRRLTLTNSLSSNENDSEKVDIQSVADAHPSDPDNILNRLRRASVTREVLVADQKEMVADQEEIVRMIEESNTMADHSQTVHITHHILKKSNEIDEEPLQFEPHPIANPASNNEGTTPIHSLEGISDVTGGVLHHEESHESPHLHRQGAIYRHDNPQQTHHIEEHDHSTHVDGHHHEHHHSKIHSVFEKASQQLRKLTNVNDISPMERELCGVEIQSVADADPSDPDNIHNRLRNSLTGNELVTTHEDSEIIVRLIEESNRRNDDHERVHTVLEKATEIVEVPLPYKRTLEGEEREFSFAESDASTVVEHVPVGQGLGYHHEEPKEEHQLIGKGVVYRQEEHHEEHQEEHHTIGKGVGYHHEKPKEEHQPIGKGVVHSHEEHHEEHQEEHHTIGKGVGYHHEESKDEHQLIGKGVVYRHEEHQEEHQEEHHTIGKGVGYHHEKPKEEHQPIGKGVVHSHEEHHEEHQEEHHTIGKGVGYHHEESKEEHQLIGKGVVYRHEEHHEEHQEEHHTIGKGVGYHHEESKEEHQLIGKGVVYRHEKHQEEHHTIGKGVGYHHEESKEEHQLIGKGVVYRHEEHHEEHQEEHHTIGKGVGYHHEESKEEHQLIGKGVVYRHEEHHEEHQEEHHTIGKGVGYHHEESKEEHQLIGKGVVYRHEEHHEEHQEEHHTIGKGVGYHHEESKEEHQLIGKGVVYRHEEHHEEHQEEHHTIGKGVEYHHEESKDEHQLIGKGVVSRHEGHHEEHPEEHHTVGKGVGYHHEESKDEHQLIGRGVVYRHEEHHEEHQEEHHTIGKGVEYHHEEPKDEHQLIGRGVVYRHGEHHEEHQEEHHTIGKGVEYHHEEPKYEHQLIGRGVVYRHEEHHEEHQEEHHTIGKGVGYHHEESKEEHQLIGKDVVYRHKEHHEEHQDERHTIGEGLGYRHEKPNVEEYSREDSLLHRQREFNEGNHYLNQEHHTIGNGVKLNHGTSPMREVEKKQPIGKNGADGHWEERGVDIEFDKGEPRSKVDLFKDDTVIYDDVHESVVTQQPVPLLRSRDWNQTVLPEVSTQRKFIWKGATHNASESQHVRSHSETQSEYENKEVEWITSKEISEVAGSNSVEQVSDPIRLFSPVDRVLSPVEMERVLSPVLSREHGMRTQIQYDDDLTRQLQSTLSEVEQRIQTTKVETTSVNYSSAVSSSKGYEWSSSLKRAEKEIKAETKTVHNENMYDNVYTSANEQRAEPIYDSVADGKTGKDYEMVFKRSFVDEARRKRQLQSPIASHNHASSSTPSSIPLTSSVETAKKEHVHSQKRTDSFVEANSIYDEVTTLDIKRTEVNKMHNEQTTEAHLYKDDKHIYEDIDNYQSVKVIEPTRRAPEIPHLDQPTHVSRPLTPENNNNVGHYSPYGDKTKSDKKIVEANPRTVYNYNQSYHVKDIHVHEGKDSPDLGVQSLLGKGIPVHFDHSKTASLNHHQHKEENVSVRKVEVTSRPSDLQYPGATKQRRMTDEDDRDYDRNKYEEVVVRSDSVDQEELDLELIYTTNAIRQMSRNNKWRESFKRGDYRVHKTTGKSIDAEHVLPPNSPFLRKSEPRPKTPTFSSNSEFRFSLPAVHHLDRNDSLEKEDRVQHSHRESEWNSTTRKELDVLESERASVKYTETGNKKERHPKQAERSHEVHHSHTLPTHHNRHTPPPSNDDKKSPSIPELYYYPGFVKEIRKKFTGSGNNWERSQSVGDIYVPGERPKLNTNNNEQRAVDVQELHYTTSSIMIDDYSTPIKKPSNQHVKTPTHDKKDSFGGSDTLRVRKPRPVDLSPLYYGSEPRVYNLPTHSPIMERNDIVEQKTSADWQNEWKAKLRKSETGKEVVISTEKVPVVPYYQKAKEVENVNREVYASDDFHASTSDATNVKKVETKEEKKEERRYSNSTHSLSELKRRITSRKEESKMEEKKKEEKEEEDSELTKCYRNIQKKREDSLRKEEVRKESEHVAQSSEEKPSEHRAQFGSPSRDRKLPRVVESPRTPHSGKEDRTINRTFNYPPIEETTGTYVRRGREENGYEDVSYKRTGMGVHREQKMEWEKNERIKEHVYDSVHESTAISETRESTKESTDHKEHIYDEVYGSRQLGMKERDERRSSEFAVEKYEDEEVETRVMPVTDEMRNGHKEIIVYEEPGQIRHNYETVVYAMPEGSRPEGIPEHIDLTNAEEVTVETKTTVVTTVKRRVPTSGELIVERHTLTSEEMPENVHYAVVGVDNKRGIFDYSEYRRSIQSPLSVHDYGSRRHGRDFDLNRSAVREAVQEYDREIGYTPRDLTPEEQILLSSPRSPRTPSPFFHGEARQSSDQSRTTVERNTTVERSATVDTHRGSLSPSATLSIRQTPRTPSPLAVEHLAEKKHEESLTSSVRPSAAPRRTHIEKEEKEEKLLPDREPIYFLRNGELRRSWPVKTFDNPVNLTPLKQKLRRMPDLDSGIGSGERASPEKMNGEESTVLKEWNPKKLLDALYEVSYEPRAETKRSRFVNMEGHVEVPSDETSTLAELERNWKEQYMRTKDGRLQIYVTHYAGEAPVQDLSLGGADIDANREERTLNIHGGKENVKVLIRIPKCQTAETFDKWRQALLSHCASSSLDAFVQPVPRSLQHMRQRTCIIELGSCSIRGGLLHQNPMLPQTFFPAIGCVMDDGSIVVGSEAYYPENRHRGELIRPIQCTDPSVERYTIDKRIVRKCVEKVVKDLGINPETYQVLLSIPQNIPGALIGEMLTTVLNEVKFKSAAITRQPSLILYGYDVTTGVVVDIGDRLNIVPVIDGYMVESAIVSIPYGATQIRESLRTSLADNNKGLFSFQSSCEKLILRYVMEHSCYVPSDYESEQQKEGNKEVNVSLAEFDPTPNMPTKFNIDSSRFMCTEGLFRPKKWGLESKGIHQLINEAVTQSPIDSRRTLFRNIFLAGGASLLPGLAERLETELAAIVPATIHTQVHISPWRYNSAFLGAQVVASSVNFEDSCITSAQLPKFLTQLASSGF